jgi:hypothetical protein
VGKTVKKIRLQANTRNLMISLMPRPRIELGTRGFSELKWAFQPNDFNELQMSRFRFLSKCATYVHPKYNIHLTLCIDR